MFENFPYTDMHQLNLDWIIKIAKDFLDQYTSLQQMITNGETSLTNLTNDGLASLQEKADTLEAALDNWYETHSEDIADQLADALADLNAWYTQHSDDIADELASALQTLNTWYTTHQGYLDQTLTEKTAAFNTAADAKAATTIASIPDDYTTLSNKVTALDTALDRTYSQATLGEYSLPFLGGWWNVSGSWKTDLTKYNGTEKFPVETGMRIEPVGITGVYYTLFDSTETWISTAETDLYDKIGYVVSDPTVKYISVTCDIRGYSGNAATIKITNANTLNKTEEISVDLLSGYWKPTSGVWNTDVSQYKASHRFPVCNGMRIGIKNIPYGYYELFNAAGEFLEYETIDSSNNPNYTINNANAKYCSIVADIRYYPGASINVMLNGGYERKQIFAMVSSDNLFASARYSKFYDICVVFGKHGGNNLPDFADLRIVPNSASDPIGYLNSYSSFLTVSTDWHGPYKMFATSNIDGDLPNASDYTGGNHNYNNDATPGYTATATCESLEYFIDGEKVTAFTGYCRRIEIRWKNLVQASNTKKADGTGRNVLEETHTLVFDGVEWKSEVTFKPLEEVRIQTYYGFQMSGLSSVYPNINFIGSDDRTIMTSSADHSSADKRTCAIAVYGTAHKLTCALDLTYDCGDRRFCEDDPIIVHSSSTKAYHDIIDDTVLPANNVYHARASYKFEYIGD